MLLVRKLKIKDNNKNTVRDLTKKMPPQGFCPLCEKKDSLCECEKLNCHCNIEAINCIWPECLCTVCLEIDCVCDKNE